MNRLYEVIYIFLWFWMFYVAAVSVFGLILWLFKSFYPGDEMLFIDKHLGAEETLSSKKESFVREYLKHDGVFLLRLISHNFGTVVTAEIVQSLWPQYVEWSESNKHQESTDQ